MAPFDPYHKWLGIPPEDQPPNHYRLLAIPLLEADADVIETAAERQTLLLRTFQTGPNSELAERLLNEVSEARVCLLDGKSKARYDSQLKAGQKPVPPVLKESVPETPAPLVTPQRGVAFKRSSSRRRSRRRPVAKAFWQQPWVMATAGGVAVVLLLILMSSGGKKVEPVAVRQETGAPEVGQKKKISGKNAAENQPSELGGQVDEDGKEKASQVEQEGLATGGAAAKSILAKAAAEKQAAEKAAAKAAATSLQKGLIAHYSFSGNAQDESGNDNHGKLNGVVPTRDRFGAADQAYQFNGQEDITAEIDNLPLGSESRTISCWVKASPKKLPSPNATRILVQWGNPEQGKAFAAHITGGTFCATKLDSGILVDSQWHHIVAIYDNAMMIYVDGILRGRNPVETTTVSSQLVIGREVRRRLFFHGSLDDIRIYNRAFSAEEVQSLYEYEGRDPGPPTRSPALNSIGMKFTSVRAGSFRMGSPSGEAVERPVHQVTLTKSFEMGVHEVTQEQFAAVMGKNPSRFKGAMLPVENVTWNEAVEFCRKLSAKENRTYRLPTEAEWEFACRAGTTTAWSFGTDDSVCGSFAWYKENSLARTHAVGTKVANAWGLHDMHGNVWEWCQDRFGLYGSRSVVDPVGVSSGSNRVDRGGSWNDTTLISRSARRGSGAVDERFGNVGFRVVREIPGESRTITVTATVQPPKPADFATIGFENGTRFAPMRRGQFAHHAREYAWGEIPDFLEGLTVTQYQKHKGGSAIRILRPGTVWMAVSPRWGGGRPEPDWISEEDYLKMGWRVIGWITHHHTREDIVLNWTIFQRKCAANESFHFRTEKYLAPVYFFPRGKGAVLNRN